MSVSSLNRSAGLFSEVTSSSITPHRIADSPPTANQSLLRVVFWVLLPPRQHGDEVVPAMKHHHHQMSKHERQHRPHNQEMPQPRQVEASHQPRQPRELHGLPNGNASQYRQHPQPNRGGVGMLLQRVVGFFGFWFAAEEKVVGHHWPYTRNVTSYEEHLLIVPAEDLV